MLKKIIFILLVIFCSNLISHANDLISKGEFDLINYKKKFKIKYYLKNSPFGFDNEYVLNLEPENLSPSYYVLAIYENDKKISQQFKHLYGLKIYNIEKLIAKENEPELIKIVITPGGNAPNREDYYIYNESKKYLQQVILKGVKIENKLKDINKDSQLDFITLEDLKSINSTLDATGLHRYYLKHCYNFDFETYQFVNCDQIFPDIIKENKKTLISMQEEFKDNAEILNETKKLLSKFKQ